MFHVHNPQPEWHSGALSWQRDEQRDKTQANWVNMTTINMKKRKWRLSEEEKMFEMKVGLEVVPVSGRGGNIMIEKWYQPFLPVGGVHANTLCLNKWIFWCIYLSMMELLPGCHSVCRRETEIHCVHLCRQNPLQCQNNFTETWLTIAVCLRQHLPLFPLFSLVCIVSF